MRRFPDLHPQWVDAGGDGIFSADGTPAPHRAGVGVSFDCPCGCDASCYIPLSNPLDGGPPHQPQRVHWSRTGEDFATLSLHPSIRRLDGCKWHGFITNGDIITCGDSGT